MTKVLIAEPDPQTQAAMQLDLRDAGYEVVVFSDGSDALDYLKSNRVDLIITDIFMPQKSGLELIEELRLRSYHVPIIAISGLRALQLGANSAHRIDFLTEAEILGATLTMCKPFSTAQLLEAVSKCIRVN